MRSPEAEPNLRAVVTLDARARYVASMYRPIGRYTLGMVVRREVREKWTQAWHEDRNPACVPLTAPEAGFEYPRDSTLRKRGGSITGRMLQPLAVSVGADLVPQCEGDDIAVELAPDLIGARHAAIDVACRRIA